MKIFVLAFVLLVALATVLVHNTADGSPIGFVRPIAIDDNDMKNVTLIIALAITALLVAIGPNSFSVQGDCCPSDQYICDDCSQPTPFCGYGKCNVFGCNCDGGCREGGCKKRRRRNADTNSDFSIANRYVFNR